MTEIPSIVKRNGYLAGGTIDQHGVVYLCVDYNEAVPDCDTASSAQVEEAYQAKGKIASDILQKMKDKLGNRYVVGDTEIANFAASCTFAPKNQKPLYLEIDDECQLTDAVTRDVYMASVEAFKAAGLCEPKANGNGQCNGHAKKNGHSHHRR